MENPNLEFPRFQIQQEMLQVWKVLNREILRKDRLNEKVTGFCFGMANSRQLLPGHWQSVWNFLEFCRGRQQSDIDSSRFSPKAIFGIAILSVRVRFPFCFRRVIYIGTTIIADDVVGWHLCRACWRSVEKWKRVTPLRHSWLPKHYRRWWQPLTSNLRRSVVRHVRSAWSGRVGVTGVTIGASFVVERWNSSNQRGRHKKKRLRCKIISGDLFGLGEMMGNVGDW